MNWSEEFLPPTNVAEATRYQGIINHYFGMGMEYVGSKGLTDQHGTKFRLLEGWAYLLSLVRVGLLLMPSKKTTAN